MKTGLANETLWNLADELNATKSTVEFNNFESTQIGFKFGTCKMGH